MIGRYLYGKWSEFHASFRDSETILWARLQMALGAAFFALQSTDLSVYIEDKHVLGYYLIGNAFFTEYLRKRREGE